MFVKIRYVGVKIFGKEVKKMGKKMIFFKNGHFLAQNPTKNFFDITTSGKSFDVNRESIHRTRFVR